MMPFLYRMRVRGRMILSRKTVDLSMRPSSLVSSRTTILPVGLSSSVPRISRM